MLVFGIGFLCGIAAAVARARLLSRPAPWWKSSGRSRVKIADLRHEESGDMEIPVAALHVRSTEPSVW